MSSLVRLSRWYRSPRNPLSPFNLLARCCQCMGLTSSVSVGSAQRIGEWAHELAP